MSLPCSDMCVLSCNMIWTYSSQQGEKYDVMTNGEVQTDNTKRAERMSPSPCCSLNIDNITVEDVGEYYCGPGGGEVYLSVLESKHFTSHWFIYTRFNYHIST